MLWWQVAIIFFVAGAFVGGGIVLAITINKVRKIRVECDLWAAECGKNRRAAMSSIGKLELIEQLSEEVEGSLNLME